MDYGLLIICLEFSQKNVVEYQFRDVVDAVLVVIGEEVRGGAAGVVERGVGHGNGLEESAFVRFADGEKGQRMEIGDGGGAVGMAGRNGIRQFIRADIAHHQTIVAELHGLEGHALQGNPEVNVDVSRLRQCAEYHYECCRRDSPGLPVGIDAAQCFVVRMSAASHIAALPVGFRAGR